MLKRTLTGLIAAAGLAIGLGGGEDRSGERGGAIAEQLEGLHLHG